MSLAAVGLVVARRLPGGGERRVLDGASAVFTPGRASLVTGPVGSGKSTLLHVLGGLLRPTGGEVLAVGKPVSRWTAPHRDRWRRKVGLALQSPALVPGLTALETAMTRLVPTAPSLGALREAAAAALDEVGLSGVAGREATSLSGGEQQRLALARALAGRPPYLLLDEPTAHQDDQAVDRVLRALAAARDRGAVVVVASHDPRLAGALDRRWALVEGRLEEG